MTRCAISFVLLLSALSSLSGEEPKLRATMDENGVRISAGDRPVLYYQRATKSLDGQWPRAGYVHPLYDLDGNVMTEDFPSDHRHHRGVFWAWHQVWLGEKRLGDPWVCKDFVWDVESIRVTSPQSPLTLIADLQWKSPHHVDGSGRMIPVVHERVQITVHKSASSHRSIDFDISLHAIARGLRIGGSEDVKGYGGFSPRIKLVADQRFFSAAGEVEPLKTAIDAGSWINIAGQQRGVVMIAHESNPVPETARTEKGSGLWILRRQRSMQNAVYPGRDPVQLSTDSPTRLRYRLVVHDGTLSSDQISSITRDYQD